MPKDVAWKKVGPLPGVLYAEMVGEVLKEQEIPYYISSDWFSVAYGIRGTSAVGDSAFIFVPEEFYEQVNHILEGMFEEFNPDSEE